MPRRIPALREADKLSYGKRYDEARSLYLWILARNPSDGEALFGLARTDAWDGCWSLAEDEFNRALSAHPEDGEVRGGLIDLLMWQQRWTEAHQLLDQGLFLDPDSDALLFRRARLFHWSFQDDDALRIVRSLLARTPNDADLLDLRNEIFVGQATVDLRADAYPGSYPNIYTFDTQLLQKWWRFDLTFDSHLVDWAGGALNRPLVDGERSLRFAYHPAPGMTTSIEAGFGNPGIVVPRAEFGAALGTPIYKRLSGQLDYSYWSFSGGSSVHILNPTLTYEATDTIDLALHAWIVHVAVAPIHVAGFADTWGAHASWKAMPRLRLVGYYTYGVQLDHDPTFAELFSLRSHVLSASADWLISADYGLRAMLGVERRAQDGLPTIVIGSVGSSFYVRW